MSGDAIPGPPGAAAAALDADPDVDRRRRRAHRRAVLSFTEGVLIGALHGAGLALVLFGAAAAIEVWLTDTEFGDAAAWSWLPGGAAAVAGALLLLSAGLLAAGALRGSGAWQLKGLVSRPPTADEALRVTNVVHALCLGLGVEPPTIEVIDDPAPNAISGRSGRRHRLLVTTGALADLSRDELEAVCAHELAHLNARDARLVGAAFSTLVRVHGLGLAAAAAGMLVAAAGFQLDLWGLFLFGVAIVIVSAVSVVLLNRPLLRLRADTDDVADCVAVHLSRHPAALAQLLGRLAADDRAVARSTGRAEHMWFEVASDHVAAAAEHDTLNAAVTVALNAPSHRELTRRQANALATAAGVASGRA